LDHVKIVAAADALAERAGMSGTKMPMMELAFV
jgi:hypothetical protein